MSDRWKAVENNIYTNDDSGEIICNVGTADETMEQLAGRIAKLLNNDEQPREFKLAEAVAKFIETSPEELPEGWLKMTVMVRRSRLTQAGGPVVYVDDISLYRPEHKSGFAG